MAQGSKVRFKISILRRCRRRLDPDNVWVKGLLDGLVHEKVLPDDTARFIDTIEVYQELVPKGKEETVVTVEMVEE